MAKEVAEKKAVEKRSSYEVSSLLCEIADGFDQIPRHIRTLKFAVFSPKKVEGALVKIANVSKSYKDIASQVHLRSSMFGFDATMVNFSGAYAFLVDAFGSAYGHSWQARERISAVMASQPNSVGKALAQILADYHTAN